MQTSESGADPFDVILVGFGPVGALFANLLGRDGIRTAAFERDAQVYRMPRAVHFDHEVMRIFQSVGLSDAILPHTGPVLGYEFRNADRELLLAFDVGAERSSQGWQPSYMFHQPALEAALRAGAAARSSVEVHLEHEVTAIREGRDDVEVGVRDLREGGERIVRARYVVGCDGASSPTRRDAGITLEDLLFDEPWLVVDATIDRPRAELGLPEHPLQLCDPARPTTFIPVAGPYIRWEFMLLPGESDEEMREPARVKTLLANWTDTEHLELIRTAVYRFHALVAEEWNTRRVFLAGDAAHQTPPFLGQGMCAGIRDAANLAWKLGLVLRGAAPAGILDSYPQERSPHVRQVIELAVSLGQIICTRDPLVAKDRDARMLAERNTARPPGVGSIPSLAEGVLADRSDEACSQLVGALGLQARVRDANGSEGLLDDVVGPGFRLLCFGDEEPRLADEARATLERVGGRVVRIAPRGSGDDARADSWLVDCDGDYARWMGVHGCEAVLVRPDHVIFGACAQRDGASDLLLSLGKKLTGPPRRR